MATANQSLVNWSPAYYTPDRIFDATRTSVRIENNSELLIGELFRLPIDSDEAEQIAIAIAEGHTAGHAEIRGQTAAWRTTSY